MQFTWFILYASLWILGKNVNLFVSMNKILYVPGQTYSTLNVSHYFTSMQTNLFDIKISLNLTQTSMNDQNNAIFDLLAAQKQSKNQFLDCYKKTYQSIENIYSQYNPCRQICSLSNISQSSQQFILQNYSSVFGNNSYPKGQSLWIIDNTFYPCSSGAYMPQLYLNQLINVSIQQNKLFSSLVQIVFLIILQICIISLAYLMISINKYKNLKSELEKMKSSQEAQQILNSFLKKDSNKAIRCEQCD